MHILCGRATFVFFATNREKKQISAGEFPPVVDRISNHPNTVTVAGAREADPPPYRCVIS